jgi:adenylate cyclase
MTTIRKLAAILAADVVGYSRLMQEDEAGTLAALKQRRKEILQPTVAQHRGRIIKVMGDGVLVEFASAVAAVQCAIELQQAMSAANSPNDANDQNRKTILLRIGVNLGEVVVEGSDLYGDGVNVAARLEGIAEPGTICISAKVRDEVQGKIDVKLEDMGEVSLKSMERPVRVFSVSPCADLKKNIVLGNNSELPHRASKPSIAVLPFGNLSGDPEQQYFSDGVTEEIITELARYRSLFVIARNSSFRFRGSGSDIGAIRRKLGVRYVVEGSIRRSGSRLRVTAQLIDAETETHLWAERYDRDVQDIFAVQDDVARTVAATLVGRVAANGMEQAKRKPTSDLAAYDYYLRGRERDAVYDLEGAEIYYARAIDLDPGFVHAHAFRAIALVGQYWLEQQPEMLQRAEASARMALSLDDHDSASHDAMGYLCLHQRKFELAGVHLNRAMSLNPNDPYVAADRANWLVRIGKPTEALQTVEMAMERDPYLPIWLWEIRSNALFHLGRYDEAIVALRNMSTWQFWHYAHAAAALAHAGRLEEARQELAMFLAARPNGSISFVAASEPYAEPRLLDHLLDGLRKAGLQD